MNIYTTAYDLKCPNRTAQPSVKSPFETLDQAAQTMFPHIEPFSRGPQLLLFDLGGGTAVAVSTYRFN